MKGFKNGYLFRMFENIFEICRENCWNIHLWLWIEFFSFKKIYIFLDIIAYFVYVWYLQHWKWFSFLVSQVMPGLLLCFVLRYDAYKKSQLNSIEAGIPQPINTIQKITYFHCSLIGYFLGKSFQPHFFLSSYSLLERRDFYTR